MDEEKNLINLKKKMNKIKKIKNKIALKVILTLSTSKTYYLERTQYY